MKEKNIVTAIYFHPEAYPPTLNALTELSKCVNHISVLHRPHLQAVWQYPPNVSLHASGTPMKAKEQEQASIFKKVSFFLAFTWHFYKLIKKEKPALVLVYDNMSLFSFSIIRRFVRGNIEKWYHNHDVAEPGSQRKYSLGWWSLKAERKAFRWLTVFSLPANERKQYFPLEQFKGQYFYLPNLPAISFYGGVKASRPDDCIKLIYQGSVTQGHGLEEMIGILNTTVNGKPLQLNIAGGVSEEYRLALQQLAQQHQAADKLVFTGFIPYRELPAFTAGCHIGVAINRPLGIIYQTGGTASNKIYEYMACGLPVLYFDDAHYKTWLSPYNWAFATDLSPQSLIKCITAIDSSQQQLSASAVTAFRNTLNYEQQFGPVAQYLSQKD
jgi:glycosyltransferase involved in cell wall biosynthesis